MAHPTKVVFDSAVTGAAPTIYTYSTHVEIVPASKDALGKRVMDWSQEKSFNLDEFDVQVTVTEKFKPTWFGRRSSVKDKITAAYLADTKEDLDYYRARPSMYVRIEPIKEICA